MSDDDPFLWLEEIEGEAALAWVARQNARTLAALESDPRFGGFLPRRARCADFRRSHPLSGVSRRSAGQFLAGRDPCPRSLARDEPRLVSDAGTGMADAARHRCAVGRAKVAIGCFTAPRRCRPSTVARLVSLSDGGKDAAEQTGIRHRRRRIRQRWIFPARGQAERRLARRRYPARRARLGTGHDDPIRLPFRAEAARPLRCRWTAPSKFSAAAPRMSASASASCATRTGRCAAS